MVSETLTLDGFNELCKQYAARLGTADLTMPLKTVAMLVKADTIENFQGSHDPDGNPWLPLKRPRPKGKGQKAGTDKPLMDRGILRTASTSGATVETTRTGMVYRVTGGNTLDYAAAHQRGLTTTKPARTRSKPWVFQAGGQTIFTRRIRAHTVRIPQRQFVGFGKVLTTKIDDVMIDWLEEQTA